MKEVGPNGCCQTKRKLNKNDAHIYISKPIKMSRTEGLDLLLSTENSDYPKLKEINSWT